MQPIASVTARLVPPAVATDIRIDTHTVIADEPIEVGGKNTGPTPMELLLASLASCTTMTIALYTNRKEWPLQSVHAEATGLRNDEKPGPYERIDLIITLTGDLTDEQRERILTIAGKCPVHRTLEGGVDIQTTLA